MNINQLHQKLIKSNCLQKPEPILNETEVKEHLLAKSGSQMLTTREDEKLKVNSRTSYNTQIAMK